MKKLKTYLKIKNSLIYILLQIKMDGSKIYEIKYKVFYDNNHKEYFGKRTLTIEDDISYIINNYEVDKINAGVRIEVL